MQLTKESKMLFGKYKGVPIKHVPSKYLLFLWYNKYMKMYNSKSTGLCRYIHDNFEEIKKLQFGSKINFRY